MAQLAQLQHGLFFGTMHAAADRPLLCGLGVTHVVNLSPADCPDHFDAQINYLHVHDADVGGSELGHCLRFVHSALCAGGRVLLHCRMAQSRSPCIAAAYLMWAAHTPLSVVEVLLRIRAVWPRLAPSDADMTVLVELQLELAERPAAELPLSVAADVHESEWYSNELELCEPEPEGVSARSPVLFDGQQPCSSWQAFAARWTSQVSAQERKHLRLAALDGCRQQLAQCFQAAEHTKKGSRGPLDGSAVLRAATLIRSHEAAAEAALTAVGVSPAQVDGLRIARSHGWALALQAADPSEPLPTSSKSTASTTDALSTALIVALWGETPSNPSLEDDGVWIWTEITQHLHSRRLSRLLDAYARALDQRLSCRLAGTSTNDTAAAMAERELRTLQQTMRGLKRPHRPEEGPRSNADVIIAHLEALIGDVGLMEEPARRWSQHKEERAALSHIAPAEGTLREDRPRFWPLVIARAVAGHAPCITAASNAVVLQHNATLLLPDSIVSELGDFAAWFTSGGFQHGRTLTLLPGQGYAELSLSGRITTVDQHGSLQSHRSFEWGGRLICVSIPSLAILYALVQMIHQRAPLSPLSRAAEPQMEQQQEEEVGQRLDEQESHRDVVESTVCVSIGDLVAATGLTAEATLRALLPLVFAPRKKRRNKKKFKQNNQPVDQTCPRSAKDHNRVGGRTAGLDAAADDGTRESHRRSRTLTGSGLVVLHADPSCVSARADGNLRATEAAEPAPEDALDLAMAWQVSLNCSFVPTKPKTLMLPAVDAQVGSATCTTLQMLRGQLQPDLRSAEGKKALLACSVADTRADAVGATGAGTQMRFEGAGDGGGVSLCLRKVVPVCLWEANPA